MVFISEIIFSGFASKVVNDVVDVSKDKIRGVVRNRNTKHQNIESQIYNVIVNVLNKITNNQYENNQDSIYDAVEVLLKSIKENGKDELESIKNCLRVLGSKVDETECLKFKVLLYEELGKDGYSGLFRAILLLLLDQKNRYDNDIYMQLNQKLDEVILILNQKKDGNGNSNIKQKVESRTQEYADRWNKNMFLNDFDKRDQNAGTNVKLGEVYLEEHLPHYIWYKNNENDPSTDLKELISEYINEKKDSKMLLILGQPGIGKSTLITWITANFTEDIDDILVYRFASDLGNIDWQSREISNSVLEELGLSHSDLNGKRLIIDGFDEVNIESNRRRDILDSLYINWINNKTIENFSIIITCRENYIPQFAILKCNYITLQPWDEIQIRSFCNIFQEKTKNSVSDATKEKLLENKEILGIPLILYMVLALNISIEKEGSIVDVYDKIFALEGGIYDRCIDNKHFADKNRISEIKEQIHQISREISIWMFENNPDRASILQKEYMNICDGVMRKLAIENVELKQDFKIGNYFKLVKHCDGIDTEELSFIHRSIYEYFVVETIYNSIESSMLELSEKSQERLASNIVVYLQQGKITNTLGEYLKYKITKFYHRLDSEKRGKFYLWWESSVRKMVSNGMLHYTRMWISDYKNILKLEINCFVNLIEILRYLINSCSNDKYIVRNFERDSLRRYIKCYYAECESREECAKLNKMFLKDMEFKNTNLQDADLRESYLVGSNLENTNLQGANLQKVNLNKANLSESNLQDADLSNSMLRKANLNKANLNRANLQNSKLYQAILLWTNLEQADLQDVDLRDTDLRGANLMYAKLNNADLCRADLQGAYLKKANLQGANLYETIFSKSQIVYLEKDYDLRGARVKIEETNELINYEDFCKIRK